MCVNYGTPTQPRVYSHWNRYRNCLQGLFTMGYELWKRSTTAGSHTFITTLQVSKIKYKCIIPYTTNVFSLQTSCFCLLSHLLFLCGIAYHIMLKFLPSVFLRLMYHISMHCYSCSLCPLVAYFIERKKASVMSLNLVQYVGLA